jgi:phosphatidylglycerophosphatase A
LINRITLLFATGLGLGYLPGPTGTYGSALGLLLWLGIARGHSTALEAAVLALFLVLSIPAAGRAASLLGRKDPGQVVCDEITGQLISLLFLPLSGTVGLAGFLLFRAMDIIKPFPANKFEQLPAGWGIVADDVMAGIYANLLLRLILNMNWLPLSF